MRILIVGTSCAGKSTFARRLAAKTGIPLVELDPLYWSPNWTAKEAPEFQRLTREATAGESWIVDGNYRIVRYLLWPRATTVIWLNYSFPRVFARALRRTLRRCATREVLWHGNRESFRRSFLSKDSILLWVITTYHRRRRELGALKSTAVYPNLIWIELNHPADADHFLKPQSVNLIS